MKKKVLVAYFSLQNEQNLKVDYKIYNSHLLI